MPSDPKPFPADISGQSMEWLWNACDQNQAKFNRASVAMQELIAMEATWTDQEPEGDVWRYRLYPLGKFGQLLTMARRLWEEYHTIMASFLEVGCGPGTKCVFAQEFLWVESTGFDTSEKYINAAEELATARSVDCEFFIEDAEQYDLYNEHSIIFNNRVFRDLDRQAKLDQKIYEAMEPGTFLINGNQVTQPPGWRLIAQDVAAMLWQKTCRCEGMEELLISEDEAYLTCTVCARNFSVGPPG